METNNQIAETIANEAWGACENKTIIRITKITGVWYLVGRDSLTDSTFTCYDMNGFRRSFLPKEDFYDLFDHLTTWEFFDDPITKKIASLNRGVLYSKGI
jgi:hypothetical protein